MVYIDGMSVYHGLGNRPYNPDAPVRRIPSSITVYKGLGGHPARTSGQVGHGLGGMFRSLSKAVMPAAKGLMTRAVKRGAPKLLKIGTRKIAKVGQAQALKTLVGGKRGTNLLKSVGKTQLLNLAKSHTRKVVPKLLKTAKKKAAPTLFKAGVGLLSDLASDKNPKKALEKRSTQVRSALGKSLKKQASNVLTSFTPKSLKRQASNVLTSFAPKAKRSKGVSFQRRPSRPTRISRARARVRYTFRGPRGRKRRFNYKPARKLDIWEY